MSQPRLSLDRIEFRAAVAKTPKALLIRRDEKAPRQSHWSPDQNPAPVAFAVNQWKPGADQLDVELTLSIRADRASEVWIRAEPIGACSSILGKLSLTRLEVDAGCTSGFRTLVSLTGVELSAAAVGSFPVEWTWTMSESATAPGRTFARTHLEVYTTFREPTTPWTQRDDPGSDDYPWANALFWACRWASGATSEAAVLARVTGSLDALGGMTVIDDGRPTLFTYQSSPAFLPSSLDVFRLTQFLSLVGGNMTVGVPRANCADLAAAIAVFANLLGCSVSLREVTPNGGLAFPVHPLRVFGLDESDSVHHHQNGFAYHRAASLESAGPAIYDACVQLDFEGSPGVAPFGWSPAVGLVMSAPSGTSYLERLVPASSGIQSTTPGLPSVNRGMGPTLDAMLEKRYRVCRELLERTPEDTMRVQLTGSPPGLLVSQESWQSPRHGDRRAAQYLWRRADDVEIMVDLDIIETTGRRQSIDIAAEFLASAAVVFEPVPDMPSLVMSAPSRAEAVFVGEGHVVIARSSGSREADVTSLARLLWGGASA